MSLRARINLLTSDVVESKPMNAYELLWQTVQSIPEVEPSVKYPVGTTFKLKDPAAALIREVMKSVTPSVVRKETFKLTEDMRKLIRLFSPHIHTAIEVDTLSDAGGEYLLLFKAMAESDITVSVQVDQGVDHDNEMLFTANVGADSGMFSAIFADPRYFAIIS